MFVARFGARCIRMPVRRARTSPSPVTPGSPVAGKNRTQSGLRCGGVVFFLGGGGVDVCFLCFFLGGGGWMFLIVFFGGTGCGRTLVAIVVQREAPWLWMFLFSLWGGNPCWDTWSRHDA